LTELASLQTFQADVCEVASLVYEPGATKLSFFLNSGPKKVLSLSLNVKDDPQIHKKNDASNYGINLAKVIRQSSHNYFPMLHYGRQTHNNRAVFFMGSQNIMGSDYGSNISASVFGFFHCRNASDSEKTCD
jgi:hypothetical protein